MEIDVRRLRELHPDLDDELVVYLMRCAALALGRVGHRSGVEARTLFVAELVVDRWWWEEAPPAARAMYDEQRVTEEGASAIALVIAAVRRGWWVDRRLQTHQRGDWLLHDPSGTRPIRLEVSGVGTGRVGARVARKKRQVTREGSVEGQPWVCVVEFASPLAVFAPARGEEP